MGILTYIKEDWDYYANVIIPRKLKIFIMK